MAVDNRSFGMIWWRCWRRSVSLICESVVKRTFESFTIKSKTVIFSLLDLWVNLMLLSKLLRSSKKFSSLSLPSVKIKKMSSVYLNYTKDCIGWTWAHLTCCWHLRIQRVLKLSLVHYINDDNINMKQECGLMNTHDAQIPTN